MKQLFLLSLLVALSFTTSAQYSFHDFYYDYKRDISVINIKVGSILTDISAAIVYDHELSELLNYTKNAKVMLFTNLDIVDPRDMKDLFGSMKKQSYEKMLHARHDEYSVELFARWDSNESVRNIFGVFYHGPHEALLFHVDCNLDRHTFRRLTRELR